VKSLQDELLEADRNLQEVDICIDTLRGFKRQSPVNGLRSNDFSGHANPLHDTSDSSEDFSSEHGDLA